MMFERREKVLILSGSNLGDKKSIINQAAELLESENVDFIKKSNWLETEPWGFDSNEWFLNQSWLVETTLQPEGLMKALLNIETQLGRIRNPEAKGYQDRPIDLDILLWGDRVWDSVSLKIPHPAMHLREFALAPSAEVAGEWKHPVLKESINQLLQNIKTNGQ